MKENILEDLIVVKRSGQRVNFTPPKIAIAIKHAFDSIEKDYDEININKVYERVLEDIISLYEGRKTINVEDIQDIIEKQLKLNKYEDVYLSFSKYRQNRKASREAFAVKQQHKFFKSLEYLNNYKIGENETISKTLNNFGNMISSEFAKSYLIDAKYIRAHEEGSIYIHNIDNFLFGLPQRCHLEVKDDIEKCLFYKKLEISQEISIPKIDFLLESNLIEIFKKHYINTLFNYLTLMGFVNYINFEKIKQIIDNQDTINFSLDLLETFIYSKNVREIFNKAYIDSLEETKVVLYNKLVKVLNTLEGNYTFSLGTNNSFEGKIINEIYLRVIKENDTKQIKTIFKVKKGINNSLKDSNYFLLEEVSNLIEEGKDIYISYMDTTYNKGDVEYFENSERILENVNNDKEISLGRMVLATTSINLAQLALSNKNKELFYKELEETLDLVKNELILDFEYKGDKFKENFAYLFNNNILDDEKLEGNQKIRKVIKNGTLNIGLVGIKESLFYLYQNYDEGELLNLLNFIREKCDSFIFETKLNFVISEVRDEFVLSELIKIDKSIYGLIKNVTNKELYESINTIKKDLKVEGKIHNLLNGGYETLINKQANKKVLDYILELNDFDIGFVKFNLEKKSEL